MLECSKCTEDFAAFADLRQTCGYHDKVEDKMSLDLMCDDFIAALEVGKTDIRRNALRNSVALYSRDLNTA